MNVIYSFDTCPRFAKNLHGGFVKKYFVSERQPLLYSCVMHSFAMHGKYIILNLLLKRISYYIELTFMNWKFENEFSGDAACLNEMLSMI